MKKLLIIAILAPLFYNAQVSFFRSYGGSGNDFGESVLLTSDTCYLVVGATESFGNGATDLYVFKVDSLGEYIWSRTYGGPNIDYGTDAIEMNDGSFLLSGYSNSGTMGYDFFLVKTSSSGQHQWTKRYGGVDWDLAYSICKINHSTPGYLLAGETYSYGAGSTDAYLIKVNELGDTIWTHTYGGANEEVFKEIIEDDYGNIICIGSTSSNTMYNDSDIWVVKTDSLGNEIWNFTLSDTLDDEGISICLASNGNYLIAGNDQQPTNVAAYFASLNTSGSLIYSNEYSGPSDDYSSAILRHQDSTSYTLICNSYSFGGGNGYADILYTQLNGMFAISNLTGLSGTLVEDISTDADTTADHSIIITGTTRGTLNGMTSVFLLKTDTTYNSFFTITEDLDLSNPTSLINYNLTVYPNPAIDYIHLKGISNNDHLYIWDSNGKLIYESKNKHEYINIKHLRAGLYFIGTQKFFSKTTCFIKL